MSLRACTPRASRIRWEFGLLILGMMLQAGFSLTTVKLFILLALLFFTAPVVTHALAQTCLHENVKPLLTSESFHGQVDRAK